MIEEGTYRARSLRGQLGKTSTGKEQLGVEWLLLDGTMRTIWSYHYFSSEKAIEISMEGLRNAGFIGNDLSDLSSLKYQEELNPTPECELVIQHEEYEGKVRAKVRFINSGGGMGMSNPLDGNEAKAFAARMRGQIAAFDLARGTAPRATSPKPGPSNGQRQLPPSGGYSDGGPGEFVATDEDVPF